ncbi:solute carrier family 35 member F1-like isoform X7 [Vitis riparia]|uniref:solute carrier family 35 member F1-like isoform X7 n=1 Tax=Vitis riparia TaxID=96939 RepID=UPI00155A9AE4|nr:solute carrier family 35 member F1-like isoform X7 [Vitis riparia]
MSSWWRSHGILLRTLYVLFLGQVVSFVLAVASFSSSFIADLGVDAPLTQSFFTYLSLALVYGSILLYRRQKLRISWYWYLFLGFVDVQGNYLGGSRPLLGDILVIAGTLFFALSNVGEEFCVKKKDRVEVVTMIGIFGLLVSVCEISIMELKSLESVEWSTDIILGFVGYAVSTFLFYTIVPFLLQISGATWFNLSLLTSDMWAVVFRIFFYHQKVDWLYYISFAMVAVGLIIYSKTEKDPIPLPTLGDGNHNAEYQVLDEESTESRNETPAS